MSKTLAGIKIAILVANGFNQQDFTAVQKVLNSSGAGLKLVSPDQGLVNGWEGSGWGHHFPVDQQLGTALGVDFDILVVPGGQRCMDKLKTTAHTKRFVNSFMVSAKKIVLFSEAVELLDFAGQGVDSSVHDNVLVIDNLENVDAILEFLASKEEEIQQAA